MILPLWPRRLSCDILDAPLDSNLCYTWKSILGARPLVELGSRWLIGDGNSLNIWIIDGYPDLFHLGQSHLDQHSLA